MTVSKIFDENDRLIEVQRDGKVVYSREKELEDVKNEARIQTIKDLESEGAIPEGSVDKIKKNIPKEEKQRLKDKGVI